MSIKLRWLGYVCFEIVLPSGKVLVTDPFIDYSPTSPIKCQEVTGADYIAITHGDFDHVTDTGSLVKKFNSKVICSHQLAGPLSSFFGLDKGTTIRTTAGGVITFEDLRVEVKKAEHPNIKPENVSPEVRAMVKKMVDTPELLKVRSDLQAAGFVPGEQLNFVFQTTDNLRLYLFGAGPYDFLREEVRQARPNILLLQCGGIDSEKQADIAAISGAEVVMPTHHDFAGPEGGHKIAQEMARLLAARSRAQFVDIVHGRWYEIGAKASPADQ